MNATVQSITACWIYAISHFGYPPSINDTFDAVRRVAALGFRAIELEAVSLPGKNETNVIEVYSHLHDLWDLCAEQGLQVSNFFAVFPDLVDLDSGRRSRGLGLFEQGVEMARSLGSPLISVDSFPPPAKDQCASGAQVSLAYDATQAYGRHKADRLPKDFSWDEQWQVLVEVFCRCADLAEEAGLRLALEPRVGEMVSNTDGALRLIEAVGRANFGVVLDTGHQYAQKENLSLAVHKLGSRIFFVHLSDNDGRDNLHLQLGEGTIDWIAFFAALRDVGYRGSLGIDVGGVPDVDLAFLRSKELILKMEGPSQA